MIVRMAGRDGKGEIGEWRIEDGVDVRKCFMGLNFNRLLQQHYSEDGGRRWFQFLFNGSMKRLFFKFGIWRCEEMFAKFTGLQMAVALLMLCLILQGCVGIDVSRPQTEVFQNPQIAAAARSKGLCGSGGTNSITYSAAWLEGHWGKPARIVPAGAGSKSEVWVYKFDLIWAGVTPMVMIPIPIKAPVGREQVQFVLQNGQVVSGCQRSQRNVGGVYGVYPGICGFQCGATSWDE